MYYRKGNNQKSSDWSSRFGPKRSIVDDKMKTLNPENNQEIEM